MTGLMSIEAPIMQRHSEQRGNYEIVATAHPLQDGRRWHPELRLTRLPAHGRLARSQTFCRLKPMFDSANVAIRYAAELGRCLVDESSPLLEI